MLYGLQIRDIFAHGFQVQFRGLGPFGDFYPGGGLLGVDMFQFIDALCKSLVMALRGDQIPNYFLAALAMLRNGLVFGAVLARPVIG